MRTKVRIVLLVLLLLTIAVSSLGENELFSAWIICQTGDYINVRMNPSRKSQIVGYADAGDSILVDGTEKNGYLKCYGIGDMGEGWIHSGYVIYEEPERVGCTAVVVSRGKLAARKHINGKVRKWLHNMDQIKVYWISSDWCVTNEGFIRTEFLEMEGQ